MTDTHDQQEAMVSAIGEFPNRESRIAFLRQVQLWNAVEGLPFVFAQSLKGGDRVMIRTAASAGKGIVRLIEAVGGFTSPV